MKKIVNEVLNKDIYGFPVKQIDTTIYIYLDEDRRIKVRFCTTFSADSYNAIQLELVSKTKGNLDTKITSFREIFEEPNDLTHVNKINKHLWRNQGKIEWYGKPTKEDLESIIVTIKDYVSIWE